MWFKQYNRYKIFTVLIFVLVYNGCEAISNALFNEQIRDYSVINDDVNVTNVKTLQKDNTGLSRYASFAPLQNAIRFKEVPDNVLSGSNHGRGLLHHDHSAGYGLYEYEDPHYNPGYGYQHDPGLHDPGLHNPGFQDPGIHDPHAYHHYDFHDPPHHGGHHVSGYGHHHKHYDHALDAKSLLWPIAGIALLGAAAAALVSNPVLLHLGVVSGRKKRQIENLGFVKESIQKWTPKSVVKIEENLQNIPEFIVKRRFIKNDLKVKPTVESLEDMEHKSSSKILKVLSRRYMDKDEEKMVPVPLQFRNS